MPSRSARGLVLILLLALVPAACGGGGLRTGRTVTFQSGGNFPPTTIVGRYSAHGCAVDAHRLVDSARLYYAHSTWAPAPADLYYYDMRFDYAHFQADGCTSKQLGGAMKAGLTTRQQTFLLHNVASNLQRAFRAALDRT
jgi:hypothetical protein